MSPKGPFQLITVNTAPERAKIVIGRVIEALKEDYTIDYVANCTSIGEVADNVRNFQPDVLFSASMWKADDVVEIQRAALLNKPDIKLHAIPFGLQVERGPDGVVEHLLELNYSATGSKLVKLDKNTTVTNFLGWQLK